jgi:hypothetical protein
MAVDERLGLGKKSAADHPLQGVAQKAQRRLRVHDSILRAEARIAGYERILSDIANHDGVPAALEVAKEMRWNGDWWLDSWQQRQHATQQTTTARTSEMYDEDARHDPRVTALIMSNAPMSAVNAMIAAVDAEKKAAPRPAIGPGQFAPEPVQPPRQRTLVSTAPAAQYNADTTAGQIALTGQPLPVRDRSRA